MLCNSYHAPKKPLLHSPAPLGPHGGRRIPIPGAGSSPSALRAGSGPPDGAFDFQSATERFGSQNDVG